MTTSEPRTADNELGRFLAVDETYSAGAGVVTVVNGRGGTVKDTLTLVFFCLLRSSLSV